MNDERLREILPILRPRSEDPGWPFIVLFILLCAGLVALIVYYIVRKRRQRQLLEQRFCKLGLEKGLDPEQTGFLLERAWQAGLKNPLLLLNSVYVFDRHVGGYASRLADHDPRHPDIDLIARVRPILGFDQVPPDQPLRSTRQLELGLTAMVWHQEEGEEAFYPWVVVARDERALTLVPLLKEDFPRFAGLRKGHSLTARFWRAADTEYRFTSDILAIERDSHAVILRHADSIERLQQRDFYRLDVHFEAIFFAVPEGGEDQEEAEEEERLAASSEPGRAQGALESEDVLSPGSEEADAVPFPDLDHALRVEAQVINLSAGGLSALTPTQVPPQYLLLIDPDFEGPFPLGGIFCKIVHASPLGDATHLQVQFIDLPPAREAELVRCVYHYQTQRVRTGSDPLPEA